MTLADEIRALRVKRLSTYYSGWNAAIDRAAALAEAHESALVAAAYEAAADKYAEMGVAGEDGYPAWDYFASAAAAIRAMTPADANAALDRMLTEARKEGMREAARLVRPIADAILAAAEKESGNG